MSILGHPMGLRDANLVVRHLKLDGVNWQNQNAIINAIDNIFDVDSVQFDEQTATLHLAYDSSFCELDGLEEILIQHDVDVFQDWRTPLKKDHY